MAQSEKTFINRKYFLSVNCLTNSLPCSTISVVLQCIEMCDKDLRCSKSNEFSSAVVSRVLSGHSCRIHKRNVDAAFISAITSTGPLPRVRDSKVTSLQGNESPRVGESKGRRTQGYENPRVRESKDTRIEGYENPSVRESKGTRIQGYENLKVRESKGTRI